MIRLLGEILLVVNGIGGLIGWNVRRAIQRRGVSHEEYQARLRRENEEIDRMREEIGRGIRH